MHTMSGRVGQPETGGHCIPTSFKQLMSSSLARKGEEKGEKNIYRARPSYQHDLRFRCSITQVLLQIAILSRMVLFENCRAQHLHESHIKQQQPNRCSPPYSCANSKLARSAKPLLCPLRCDTALAGAECLRQELLEFLKEQAPSLRFHVSQLDEAHTCR